MNTREVVLVHGMYHEPLHFKPLAMALRARGFTVHVPRLYRGSLAGDTEAVQAAVDECDGPPIAVGHSHGGAVITGLSGIEALVYLAAFIPDVTESCAMLGGPDALINRWARPHVDGGTFIRSEDAIRLFYADCRLETARWAAGKLVPQEPGHGRGHPVRAAWKDTPSIDVVCADDRAMDQDLQRRLARRCTSSVELASSHSPYLSRPTEVAQIIESVAEHG